MQKAVKEIFASNGIDLYGAVPFEKCIPANVRLYEKYAGVMKTVLIFAIPYKTSLVPEDGYKMSAYARVYDYHKKFVPLFEKLNARFKERFPGYAFEGYVDHSPVNEKHASLLAGMGVAGRNSLLITRKYGSFVFLGSVMTDMPFPDETREIKTCIDCGRCIAACPANAIRERGIDPDACLSGINQKKKVSPEEAGFIAKSGYVWGCDECQNACPLNAGALTTDDGYFTEGFIKNLSAEWLSGLSDEEFERYPFSWRKREVIMRNIALIDERRP
ncbi:MAG: epoxyqueuosine reductase [Clostridia bacterium]|nr:epoxyqueuosine reductase [Clostridia bacterium]